MFINQPMQAVYSDRKTFETAFLSYNKYKKNENRRGRVKILKKCTEFVIRVIKAHHIPALSDDQSLNLCVKSNIKT